MSDKRWAIPVAEAEPPDGDGSEPWEDYSLADWIVMLEGAEPEVMERYRPLIPVVERAAGVLLIIVGVLVASNYYTALNAWANSVTPDWLRERL